MRSAALIAQMSRSELLTLLRGYTSILTKPPPGDYEPANGLGFVRGVERLGVPVLRQTDGQMGVGDPAGNTPSAEATQLPSGLAIAATWNPDLAEEAGAVLGREAYAKGFNVVLAGSVNLIRDPRCGRCFEYPGEDPLLAGVVVGRFVRGVQSVGGIVATVKHFALNAYENGRMQQNVVIDRASAMESDLLAFRLALAIGDPGAAMASYNAINGDYATENHWLLTEVLRDRWQFQGWAMSDFGAVHSTARAALAGLDQESACEADRIIALGGMALLNGALPALRIVARVALSWMTGDIRRHAWFGEALARAVEAGEVPEARLREMARRIVRVMAKHGLLDAPKRNKTVDVDRHAEVAHRAAREAVVLLKNDGSTLPLRRNLNSVAVIGKHADVGLPSGMGSPAVLPIGGNAIRTGRGRLALLRAGVWVPCSPFRNIASRAPQATVTFADGTDIREAERLATRSEVAIVFVHQPAREGQDQSDLSLPLNQDALVRRVAAVAPCTIVVISCGGPVATPWADAVGAILCGWYSGQRGAEAIAEILFGECEPSGRLPVTFPKSLADLPRPQAPATSRGREGSSSPFDIRFDEGAEVGYRWFASRGLPVLFPFGHGLTYTRFHYDSLAVSCEGDKRLARITITNVGDRQGLETVQVYVENSGAGLASSLRLGGWARIGLKPGEAGEAAIEIPAFVFGRWNEYAGCWTIKAGPRRILVGASSRDIRLECVCDVEDATAPP